MPYLSPYYYSSAYWPSYRYSAAWDYPYYGRYSSAYWRDWDYAPYSRPALAYDPLPAPAAPIPADPLLRSSAYWSRYSSWRYSSAYDWPYYSRYSSPYWRDPYWSSPYSSRYWYV